MQKVLNLPEGHEDEAWKVEGGGVLFNVLKKMFKLINRYVISILGVAIGFLFYPVP